MINVKEIINKIFKSKAKSVVVDLSNPIDVNSDRVVGLTTGRHPFHIKIMKDNNAEIYDMGKMPTRLINEFMKLPNADVYICESNFYAPVIVKKVLLGFLNKKKIKIINIAASPGIFTNTNPILKWLMNKVDLMLVEGKYGEEQIRLSGYKGNTQIIYPDINKEYYKNIARNKPVITNGGKYIILCMARFSWKIKGLDILEQAIKDIDCEVYVAGESTFIPSTGKIHMLGYTRKQDMEELFKKCNLYIQPSRFDTFSISVLEAAYSGLPVMVSNKCGVKEFVNSDFVFNDVDELNYILKRIKVKNTFRFEEYEQANKDLRVRW